MAASQDGSWGEGDEDPVPAEPGGSHGPLGAQPQPGPLVQTCLLRDLEMGPLAQTQTLRDFEQHLNDLKKENFSLKLRIYFLEERVQQKGEGSRDDVYRRNIELKVEVESLKRELQEKQQALDNTWVAAENQTTRSQAALRQQYEERQRESEHVYELLENKIQLLQEEARLARNEAEQATALARAEAERCQELAGKLKEAARTKEEDRSDDGCGAMAQRRIEELTQELAASKQLVETLSAEKHNLQQCLGEPLAGQVLSHNLCTVLNVPHDPVALEEHFRDDDEGPVSNQGYMPYLNKFILEKVQGNFDKVEFNRMCWTLCAKKNLSKSPLLISEEDAFKVWVIFNFLSEDKYPLIIVPEEIEYLLKKLTEAMGAGWQQEQFDHYKIALNTSREGLSAWELIDLIGSGQFSKGMDRQTVSMAINEVFNELILDVLKQGYMLKKGHKRKNWTERWFVLKPNIISYYVSEDLKDKKGDIILDGNCCVEALPDKDGKKCLFLIKCLDKSFEISASDKKKKQEWIQAIQSTVNLLRVGSPPPHKEARQKRKELRRKLLAEQEELERQMKELQTANENKQKELETVRKQLEAAAARAAEEEKKRLQTQVELQDRFSLELEREKMVRQKMEEQVAQKSSELEQYLQRVRELEEMYKQLQEALEDEKQARQDEETVRKLQARLLEEESAKRAELEKWHLEQQQTIQMTEAEKQELENQRVIKERALQVAMQQLEQLELERKEALEQYEEVKKKLETAANNTKSWKDKVAHHEGLIRLIEPGCKNPHLITNWGPAAFTEAELQQRQKSWKGKKATSE